MTFRVLFCRVDEMAEAANVEPALAGLKMKPLGLIE